MGNLYSGLLFKRTQHFNSAYCNIVAHRQVAHPVETCFSMMDGVGSSLKMVKFFSLNISQNFWMLHDVVCATFFCKIIRTRVRQHTVTYCNRVAKRVPHFVHDNAAICCVEIFHAFGRGFTVTDFPFKICLLWVTNFNFCLISF